MILVITTHFNLDEFTKLKMEQLTPIQILMLQNLCNNLEVARSFLNTSISITSGIRLPSDNNALRNSGLNPSETSDHLYGNIIKLRGKASIKKYGRYYTFSVGAADFIPGCGAKEAFEKMMPYFDRVDGEIKLPNGTVKIGQLILEKRLKDSKEVYWIHISNPPELIYSNLIVNTFLSRSHFLKSDNNGGSYESV